MIYHQLLKIRSRVHNVLLLKRKVGISRLDQDTD